MGPLLFDVQLTLHASAGRDVRPAAHLLIFASPKKRRQKKGDPTDRVPFAALRGSLRCSRPDLRPSAAMARMKPLWLRLRCGACGVARAPQDARASLTDSPRLFERSAPARSEFRGAPRKRRDAGLPRSEAQGSQTWGRLFFAYFLLAKQKKVGAPPGAHPGRQRIQRQQPLTPALSPKGRGSKPTAVHTTARWPMSRRYCAPSKWIWRATS